MGVAPTPLRLGGYVRVSQVRGRDDEPERFASVDIQRERIETWSRAYGHELVLVEEELDVGGQAQRPKLLGLIERVERGQLDGIVVAYASRFGRGLVDTLGLIDRITRAAGRFVSVGDGMDTSTDTGRLVLRIMLSIAEHELDRIRGNWADAKARAVGRGVHPSAIAPFGYRRGGPPRRTGGGATGPLVPDPVTGPLVTELYQRRADGAGYSELARWLEQQGARTGYGRNEWSLRAVKDIVRNEVYLGVAYARARNDLGEDARNETAHPALTDHLTWRRAQRAGVRVEPTGEPSAIRGLLRCAGCRYKVRAERRRYANSEAWLFSCRASKRSDLAALCDHPVSLKETGEIEAWIVEQLFAGWPALRARMERQFPGLDKERAAVARDRDAFEVWRDDTRVQQRLGMDAYLDGLAARQERLNAGLAALARAEARLQAPSVPDIDAETLRALWPELTPAEQHDWLSSAIQCVFARGSSRNAPLDGRLRVVWHGEPVDLPARGDRDFTPLAFPFDDDDAVDIGVTAKQTPGHGRS
jgi:site-specific DNA recombinase